MHVGTPISVGDCEHFSMQETGSFPPNTQADDSCVKPAMHAEAKVNLKIYLAITILLKNFLE